MDDEPTVFEFDGQEYTPNNYGDGSWARVTVREALTHSLNIATVKVAELVGYGRVVQLPGRWASSQHTTDTGRGTGGLRNDAAGGCGSLHGICDGGTRAEPYFLKM